MTVTIRVGKAGRVVIPKVIRDDLGLNEGSRLKLEIQGGKLHAAPEPDPVSITLENGFPVIRGGPRLGPGAIVKAIKEQRDCREDRLVGGTKAS